MPNSSKGLIINVSIMSIWQQVRQMMNSNWNFPSTGNAKTEGINRPRGLYFGCYYQLGRAMT